MTRSSPVDQAWRLRRQLPDARLLVAPDCGHEVIRRRPTLFKEALSAFYLETAPIAVARAEGRPAPVRRRPGRTVSSAHAATPVDPEPDWPTEAPA